VLFAGGCGASVARMPAALFGCGRFWKTGTVVWWRRAARRRRTLPVVVRAVVAFPFSGGIGVTRLFVLRCARWLGAIVSYRSTGSAP